MMRKMNSTRATICSLFTFGLVLASTAIGVSSSHAMENTEASSSRKRVAIIVGSNAGLSDEVVLRYAEDDARRVRTALVDLGEFSNADAHLIAHPTADALTQKLAEIEATFDKDAPPFVFFYFSGHGDGTNLHLSGTRLPLDAIHAFLDRYPSSVRVALVDSCKSGAMIRSKGITAGPAFDIDVLRDPAISGKIVITSSSDDEVAQESDILGGSFFTHFWVAGLYGQADVNNDGLVTLEEAYRFAHFHTVHKTIEARGGVQHPSYLFNLSGEGSVVLANLRDATSRIELAYTADAYRDGSNERAPGHYFVVDTQKQLVLTELMKTEPGVSALRLPPGKYQVRKREAGRLLALDVTLREGQHVRVTDGQMREIAYEIPSGEKGTLRTNLVERQVLPTWFPSDSRLRVATGIRTGFVPTMTPMPEVTVGVDFAWRYFQVEPRLMFRGATYGASDLTFGHGQLDVGASVGPKFDFGPVRFFGGVDGGVAFLQDLVIAGASGGEFIGGAASVAFTGRVFGEVGLGVTESLDVNLRLHGDGLLYGTQAAGATTPEVGTSVGAEVGVTWTFF